MNPKNSLFSIVLGLFLLAPVAVADATSVVRTGDAVSVENDQKIDGDFYSLANILNVSGEVAGDMTSIGRKVTINGSVASDALLAGESVDVHGAVGDDLRVVGGDVVIAKPVTGDVFVVAGSVTVLSTASIGGDLIVYSGDVDVSGSVGGNILGRAETLRVDAPVKGLIDVKTTSFTIGDRADIAGAVQYESATAVERSANAKIAGDIVRNDPVDEGGDSFNARAVLVPMLMMLFSALVWYLVGKTVLVRTVDGALVRSIRPFATGFVFLFAAPVVIAILLVSVLGTMVGIATLIAYIFAILLALFSLATTVGQLAFYAYKKQFQAVTPLTIVIGSAVMVVLAFIPVLGPLVLLSLFLVTLGGLVDLVIHPAKK